MNPPTFSLLYTSRRAHEIASTSERWLGSMRNSALAELVICVDGDYPEGIAAANELKKRTANCKVVVQSNAPYNCVKGWNAAAAACSGDILVQVSDDMFPPQQWDVLLTDVGPGWWEHDAAVFVGDGLYNSLCTTAIISFKRYAKFGYLFYPKYESMFSDTELTFRAMQDGAVIRAPHIIFQHKHVDNGQRARDEVDLKHSSQARYARGQQLFEMRKVMGFPPDKIPNIDLPVYLQVTQDDFCLFEVCERLFSEGARTFVFAIPNAYWNGRTNPTANQRQVLDVSKRIEKLGATVQCIIQDVAQFRRPGQLHAALETAVRNSALDAIRKMYGPTGVVIVDGDELWVKGMWSAVLQTIRHCNPPAITAGMVPVIGLPGWPVNRAQDRVMVYLRSDVTFNHCRGVGSGTLDLPGNDVFHFTGTRKTMDEIVEKHRQSGHYDDPDYDFAGWLRDVLPNVKPGLRNAHMYKKYQIWPEIRAWAPGELDNIPASLHPFLGTEVDKSLTKLEVFHPFARVTPPDFSAYGAPIKKANPHTISRLEQFRRH